MNAKYDKISCIKSLEFSSRRDFVQLSCGLQEIKHSRRYYYYSYKVSVFKMPGLLQMQMHITGTGYLNCASGIGCEKNAILLGYCVYRHGQRRVRFLRGKSSEKKPERRSFPVLCTVEPGQRVLQVRKCAPLLESAFLEHNDRLASTGWKAVPDIWKTAAEKYGDQIALVDPYHNPHSEMTYKKLEQEILDFAEGLRFVGIHPNQKIALFADNSCRWLVADQGIMAVGAINVVRGSRSSVEELLQIYIHSESVALVVDDPVLFNELAPKFSSSVILKFVVLLWGNKSMLASSLGVEVHVYNYEELLHLGRESREVLLATRISGKILKCEAISSDDVATLVYTSGTTGGPKGVMLTHENLLHQIRHLGDIVPAIPGDKFLSLLPPWHMYERSAEYFTLTRGIKQIYTNVKNLKEDLKKHQPNYLISVPLVYDTLYSGIRKQLSASSATRKLIAFTLISISLMYMECKRIHEGKSLARIGQRPVAVVAALEWFWAGTLAALLLPIHLLGKMLVYSKIRSVLGITKASVSGGASLPLHVDRFFEAIGITLLNGYGLTESSPVVSARRAECNVLGTVGGPLHGTEFKVVDPETGNVLAAGLKGIIKVRGPQIMKGYYKNPIATNKVLDDEGWLDTGDIGWLAPKLSIGASRHCGGMLVLEGRAKDIIVLSTGENVEPTEIEAAALQSNLIQQIVVVGQDQRRLGALIVPNKEELQLAAEEFMKSGRIGSEPTSKIFSYLIRKELNKYTSMCLFQIGPFLLLEEPFTIESGLLTPTLKVRRDMVCSQFQDQIANLFK